jgi:hypothetical protein
MDGWMGVMWEEEKKIRDTTKRAQRERERERERQKHTQPQVEKISPSPLLLHLGRVHYIVHRGGKFVCV